MSDLNDALRGVIERTTGDDIGSEIRSDPDKELMLAILKVLTLMIKKMENGDDITVPAGVHGVVPFVS